MLSTLPKQSSVGCVQCVCSCLSGVTQVREAPLKGQEFEPSQTEWYDCLNILPINTAYSCMFGISPSLSYNYARFQLIFFIYNLKLSTWWNNSRGIYLIFFLIVRAIHPYYILNSFTVTRFAYFIIHLWQILYIHLSCYILYFIFLHVYRLLYLFPLRTDCYCHGNKWHGWCYLE